MAGPLAIALVHFAALAHAAEEHTKQMNEDPYRWIKWHGWFMWASFGLLIPLGIVAVRFTRDARKNKEMAAKRVQIIFYAHLIIQSIGFLVSVGGAIVSFKKLSNTFLHTHQRLGIAIWGMTWLQPFIGLIRPKRGVKSRAVWFILHWLLGTGTIILGFFNIYSGLRIYELISQTSQKRLNIAFSIQVSLVSLVYLLQDKWIYVQDEIKANSSSNSKTVVPPMVRQFSVSSQRRYYSAA